MTNRLPVDQFNSAVIGKGLLNQDVDYSKVIIKEVSGKKPYRQTVMEADDKTVKHLVEIDTLIGIVRESGKATAVKEGEEIVAFEWEWDQVPMKVEGGVLSEA